MVNVREIPLILLMTFTMVYATIGDPNNDWWSGGYFLVNHITMLALFRGHKSKTIRIIGISLNVAILLFIVLKYFVGLECERYYTFLTFGICLVGLLKLEKRNESRNRKDF